MAELVGCIVGFGVYLWLCSLGGKNNNGKTNYKNMSDSQIDNEIDKYLR